MCTLFRSKIISNVLFEFVVVYWLCAVIYVEDFAFSCIVIVFERLLARDTIS